MSLPLSQHERDRRNDLQLGLTSEDIAARRTYIGASDAVVIMSGDADKVLALWEVKTGRREPDDLSDVLPVQMGIWTEGLNCYWYEKQTGNRVTHRNEQHVHPTFPFLKGRPDGLVFLPDKDARAVWDAKHVGAFSFDMDKTLSKYQPQLHLQMACAGLDYGVLSVFSGTMHWDHRVVERDPLYEARLIAELRSFWDAVQSDTPPVEVASIEPPVPRELMRVVDMGTHNEWIHNEEIYLTNEAAAKDFETAKKSLKALVEGDVREATGRGLKIKRSTSGSLTFSKVKQK